VYHNENVIGMKTGGLDVYHYLDGGEWLEFPGIANLASIAEKSGYAYIVVTLEAPWYVGELFDEEGNRLSRLHNAYSDHLTLYEWLFTGV